MAKLAGMAELVDAHDSKSCDASHESSILSPGTKIKDWLFAGLLFWQRENRKTD